MVSLTKAAGVGAIENGKIFISDVSERFEFATDIGARWPLDRNKITHGEDKNESA